jgi:DNA-3-methyladenine glycosylase I
MTIDDKPRCFGSQTELYAHYHDTEWGVPVHDDRLLFEMLILEGAHAGLSWETVLKKREGYRDVFHNFDVNRVAEMTDDELAAALQNPGIVRHRQKVPSARQNARVFQAIQTEAGSFDTWLWAWVDGTPIKGGWPTSADIPAKTPLSDALSKDLKKRGMSFVGSTIIYAYLQAVGLVNDHHRGCWRYQP